MADRKGIHFKIRDHTTRDVQVIEVWYNDKFVATICPPPRGLKDMAALTIVSKHLRNDPNGIFIEVQKEPPVLFVRFDPFAPEAPDADRR